MSQALQLTGGEEAAEMARFIGLVDKFFDCVNVSSLTKGKFKRKVFQNPYRSGDDFRLKVYFHVRTCSYVIDILRRKPCLYIYSGRSCVCVVPHRGIFCGTNFCKHATSVLSFCYDVHVCVCILVCIVPQERVYWLSGKVGRVGRY